METENINVEVNGRKDQVLFEISELIYSTYKQLENECGISMENLLFSTIGYCWDRTLGDCCNNE